MQMHERAAAVSSCRGAFVCKQPCINSSTNVEAEARRHGSRGNTQRRCQEKPRGSGGGTRGHTSKGLFEGRTLTPHRTSLTKMSWCSSFRGSKFRHVFGKPATREHSYDGVPITHSVHDNHYCSANPCFIAVVTECTAGGGFLVLPIHHTGRVVPQHPRVCGHRGRVLDVKWNPFDDYSIASCSEDCTVKIWDIPAFGLQQNLTKARKTLVGHSRRVAIIEWHPTAQNLLLSSAYDYKVLLWDISQAGAVILHPEDLSEPLYEEDLDGSAGVLFPFYDPDTHMLYLAGKGDGNIRFYELSAEKPFISFLNEYRSVLPQKGLGVMPKRGLDVMGCEVFRFYRLIAVKDLVEPLSMIVPRKKTEVFQEDLYPLTAGNQAAVTAREWLLGINRDPVLISLNPEIKPENPYADVSNERLSSIGFVLAPPPDVVTEDQDFIDLAFLEEQLAYQDAKYPEDVGDLSEWQPDETQLPLWTYCCEPVETPPPPSDHEVWRRSIEHECVRRKLLTLHLSQLLQAFYRQQDQIRDLRMELTQKEVTAPPGPEVHQQVIRFHLNQTHAGVFHLQVRILQLELEIKNYRNHMRANF
ncbi:coronin-2A [Oryzias melastigma]|nr:coronin-2A [Oryzias melastigma]